MQVICMKCGRQVDSAALFCPDCGTALPTYPQNEQSQSNAAYANASQPQYQQYQQYQQPQSETAYANTDTQSQYQQYQQPQYQQPQYQQPQYQQPQYQQETKPVGGKYGVASLWAFAGLTLVYSLPAIGWIVCIIMAFAPQNANIKNHARGLLVLYAIALVLSILAVVITMAMGISLLDYLYDYLPDSYGGLPF